MNEPGSNVAATRLRLVLVVVRKEIREVLRDGRFWVSGAIVLGLLALALAFGVRQAEATHSERTAAQQTADAHFLDQEEKNPHAAAHYGSFVFKPGGALPFVDPGVEPFVGVSLKLEAHRRNAFDGARAQDSAGLARFGRFSVATVLQLLVPLLVVGMGFAAWSAERERGTLRLVAASGVAPVRLLAGKALGLTTALGALMLPAALLGAVIVAGAGDGAGAVPVERALALAVAYGAYFVVFLAVTLGASARAASTRASLVTLLGLWIAWALVIPRVAADAVALLVPTPTPTAFAERVKKSLADGLPNGPPREERVNAITEELMERSGYKGAETLMSESLLGGIELEAEARFENEVLDHHFDDLERVVERQDKATQWAAIVSPPAAIRSLSMAFAGTDHAHHRHFAHAAEGHRRALVDALNEELGTRGGADVWSYVAGRETWERMPKFQYRRPSAAWVLERQAVSAALLGGWVVVSVAFAFAAARRVRVV